MYIAPPMSYEAEINIPKWSIIKKKPHISNNYAREKNNLTLKRTGSELHFFITKSDKWNRVNFISNKHDGRRTINGVVRENITFQSILMDFFILQGV